MQQIEDAVHPHLHGPKLQTRRAGGIAIRNACNAAPDEIGTRNVTPSMAVSVIDPLVGGSTIEPMKMTARAFKESGSEISTMKQTMGAKLEQAGNADGRLMTAGPEHRLGPTVQERQQSGVMCCRARQASVRLLTAHSHPPDLEDRIPRLASVVCVEEVGRRCVLDLDVNVTREEQATEVLDLVTVATEVQLARGRHQDHHKRLLPNQKQQSQQRSNRHEPSQVKHTRAFTKWAKARTAKCSRLVPNARVRS